MANLAEETRGYIEDSHRIRIKIHDLGKKLVALQKEEAIKVLDFNGVIAADKALTNADKRKAALSELKAKDQGYLAIELDIESVRDDISLLEIQLKTNTDMIKLNLTLLTST